MPTQYASRTDLERFGINPVAIQALSTPTIDAELLAASVKADSYMRGRFSLPLLDWEDDLRMHVCYLAAYNILIARGMNPEAGADTHIRLRYDDALAWLDGVQRQAVHPKVVETPVPVPRYEFPQITTGAKRGWT